MRPTRLLALLFVFSGVVFLAGCGSSNTLANSSVGNFSNASLNGSYAFTLSGTNAGGAFAVAGSFQANGGGVITSGTEDINSPGTVGVLLNQSLTGTYAVRPDGRGTATLTSGSTTFNLAFVLINTSTGLTIRFQNTGTASGTLDLQNGSAFSLLALTGSFAFNVSGADNLAKPEADSGLIALDSGGNITSGVIDQNDNGVITALNAVSTPVIGALAVPVSGRSTLTVPTTSLGTLHFAVYIVDTNHLKLVETDGGFPIVGEAFRGSTTAVSGSFAFTAAGAGLIGGNGAFVSGGILNTDGAGNFLGTSVADVDNGGAVVTNAAVTGTYAVVAGRGTATITGAGTLHFVFYPTSGGLLLMGTDTTSVSTGTAFQQTGGPFSTGSITGPFGLNLTGTNSGGEVDAIAQFSATGGGSLTGALDLNNGGVATGNLALTGTYTVTPSGRGTATLNSAAGPFNIVFYMASTSRVVFIEPDAFQVSSGIFLHQ
jgi:fibronectin-binding autotransporter adhesin